MQMRMQMQMGEARLFSHLSRKRYIARLDSLHVVVVVCGAVRKRMQAHFHVRGAEQTENTKMGVYLRVYAWTC